ncbi:MAG: NAD-dependent epimerase/dehydratase family protein [Planctomycetes bacterium]|nr:NAD-dependent epimerase/dehydratase family protein [Planctomycetota bacterium]
MTTADHRLPETIADEEELDDLLSQPTEAAIRAMAQVEGDLILLGVAGKMGPTLARMASRACEAAGTGRRIFGASRFSDPSVREKLQSWGIETIQADLLDEAMVDSLPEVPNVIYMTGMKFGTSDQAATTWAMNTLLPASVCGKYGHARIVAFSTGNVYPLVGIESGGSREDDGPNPVGEYGMSCLGRERIFEYFSRTQGTPTAILRLNYAHELRYGVLVDVAKRVFDEQPIDVSMGHVNVIWQGDANAVTLAALGETASPPSVLNVAGPEILSIRRVAEQFGRLMDRTPRLTGSESPDALLNNGSRAHGQFGRPRVNAERLIRWIADWISRGKATLGKPTHYEVRNGKF